MGCARATLVTAVVLSTDTGRIVMPGPLRGVRMDSPDTLRARWITEQQRLVLYRRQRATVHCDQTRSLEAIVSDAEDLDRCIFLTLALMEEIEDELNARRPGTYEHANQVSA